MKNYLRKILPQSVIIWTHKVRGFLAATIFRMPAKNIRVIMVTGTNGKTTTCHMIKEILKAANYRVAMATTIDFEINGKKTKNLSKMTTLSPFALQKFIREAVNASCHWLVLETTSHAIAQHRIWGIKPKIAVLTNITHDHLDYHNTYEEYRNTKAKIFEMAETSIINMDDKSASYFLGTDLKKIVTYGLDKPEKRPTKPDIFAKKIILEPTGSLFTVITPESQVAINLGLPGKFNIYNALAALSVGVEFKLNLELIKMALEKVTSIPGRMESINLGQPFAVIIDYAHTPDALEKIYETLELSKRGRIISVFGACGDRDRSKRPIMGALAGRFADIVIVTNEDPYSEEPVKIIEEVASGVNRGETKSNRKVPGENFYKILDRRDAIEKAFELAQSDDVVLITGKGAEECMVVGDKKIPWSDRKVVKELLMKRREE
ncbi:MAG: UDP-N-acetylmuramoyl-L-alanyl-D-glutamate--2,6-diaminopimelate ligase [Patescibacteria group bacterium]